MDKNTFLAVVLSGAIMVIWYAVFPPPEPPSREYTDSNENKFWAKVQRVSSNLESGLGKQQFMKASEKYKFLLEKDCKYAISFFREVNFLAELKCK